MHLLITILAFLVIFSILILVHEAGHFIVARRNGIKIEEFGFGLPPRLWGKKYGEVLYSINWIPFGGFVRMLGEDPSDPQTKKNPRSFMRKTKWQRTKVVCAGVIMNFLLAWVLLSVGFILGMQPLIVGSDDFLNFIKDERIEILPGLYVDSVEDNSLAAVAGFKKGDRITTLNGEKIKDLDQFYAEIDGDGGFTANGVQFDLSGDEDTAGLNFNVFDLPRVFVNEVEFGPLQKGDVIWEVNGEQVFYAEELADLLVNNTTGELEFMVVRDGSLEDVKMTLPDAHRTIISHVFAGSPAEQAGIAAGDILLSVNGEEVWIPEQAVRVAGENESDNIEYIIQRGNTQITYAMTRNEEGYVGVLLGINYTPQNQGFSYYDGVEMSSVVEIHDVKYPVYIAPFEAFYEMKRISVYTAIMVGQLFGDVFTTASVPEGVAGPVGIAQMTGLYVQEGFVALFRFLALLSLSLGVINIFPFPALDGGRLAFIIVEAIRGKPVDAKVEGMIHSLGFIFLLLVIFLVTFQDIARLF